MIYGIGTDIIEISRIKSAIDRRSGEFLNRFFTDREIKYFKGQKECFSSVAANFAAKEAFSKAIGMGVRGFQLREIGILRDHMGKPYFEETSRLNQIKNEFGISDAHVTLSHSRENAIATVILEKEK